MDKRVGAYASAAAVTAVLLGGGVWMANAVGDQPTEPASQLQVADTPSTTIAPTTTPVEVTTTTVTVVPVEAPPAPAPVQPKVAAVDTGVVTTPEPPAPQPEPAPADTGVRLPPAPPTEPVEQKRCYAPDPSNGNMLEVPCVNL